MADEPRWRFEKLGLGYHCWNEDMGTDLNFTHIRRSRGDLQGELAISTRLANVKTNNGVLHVARFNVLSSSTRSSLATMLEKRTPGHDMDWFDALEMLCQGVIVAESAGEPVAEVGLDDPKPFGDHFMVEPLILKGRSALLFGPGGVGKSLIALACGLSVAAGKEIIPGIRPAVHGPILYLDWETTADVINDRIQAIARGHDFQPVPIHYRRCIRPLADDAEELSAIVASKRIQLVIVDSAAYAMGAQGEYGDANESILRLHEALRLIGGTAQIVDHVNKTDARSKGGTASPYGSAYKTNAVRTSWEVRKGPSPEGELRINLYHAKSNDTALLDPIGITLDWTYNSIRFRESAVLEEEEDLTVSVAERETVKELILDLLSNGEKVQMQTFLKTYPRVTPNTMRGTMNRMVSKGEVKHEQGGWYMLARQPIKLRSLPGSKGVDA